MQWLLIFIVAVIAGDSEKKVAEQADIPVKLTSEIKERLIFKVLEVLIDSKGVKGVLEEELNQEYECETAKIQWIDALGEGIGESAKDIIQRYQWKDSGESTLELEYFSLRYKEGVSMRKKTVVAFVRLLERTILGEFIAWFCLDMEYLVKKNFFVIIHKLFDVSHLCAGDTYYRRSSIKGTCPKYRRVEKGYAGNEVKQAVSQSEPGKSPSITLGSVRGADELPECNDRAPEKSPVSISEGSPRLEDGSTQKRSLFPSHEKGNGSVCDCERRMLSWLYGLCKSDSKVVYNDILLQSLQITPKGPGYTKDWCALIPYLNILDLRPVFQPDSFEALVLKAGGERRRNIDEQQYYRDSKLVFALVQQETNAKDSKSIMKEEEAVGGYDFKEIGVEVKDQGKAEGKNPKRAKINIIDEERLKGQEYTVVIDLRGFSTSEPAISPQHSLCWWLLFRYLESRQLVYVIIRTDTLEYKYTFSRVQERLEHWYLARPQEGERRSKVLCTREEYVDLISRQEGKPGMRSRDVQIRVKRRPSLRKKGKKISRGTVQKAKADLDTADSGSSDSASDAQHSLCFTTDKAIYIALSDYMMVLSVIPRKNIWIHIDNCTSGALKELNKLQGGTKPLLSYEVEATDKTLQETGERVANEFRRTGKYVARLKLSFVGGIRAQEYDNSDFLMRSLLLVIKLLSILQEDQARAKQLEFLQIEIATPDTSSKSTNEKKNNACSIFKLKDLECGDVIAAIYGKSPETGPVKVFQRIFTSHLTSFGFACSHTTLGSHKVSITASKEGVVKSCKNRHRMTLELDNRPVSNTELFMFSDLPVERLYLSRVEETANNRYNRWLIYRFIFRLMSNNLKMVSVNSHVAREPDQQQEYKKTGQLLAKRIRKLFRGTGLDIYSMNDLL